MRNQVEKLLNETFLNISYNSKGNQLNKNTQSGLSFFKRFMNA